VSESEPIDLNIDDNEVEPVNNSANDIDSKVNTENSDKMIEDNHITAGDVVSTQDDIAEIELIKDDLQSDIETSSSESDSSKHIVTNNNIVKKNIATLAEVSKEEKIVSWMNSK
jgi:dynactin complex subunit